MSYMYGVSGALKAVQRVKRKLERADFCKTIADEAASIARNIYAISDYHEDDSDYSVTTSKTEDGAVITASGRTVLFREYGTGIRYAGEVHPWNDEHGMGPGTWPDPHYSKNSKGELVPNWMNDRGWWWAANRLTKGNPPAMAMYEAYKHAEEKAEAIVQNEVRA